MTLQGVATWNWDWFVWPELKVMPGEANLEQRLGRVKVIKQVFIKRPQGMHLGRYKSLAAALPKMYDWS